MFNAVPMRRDFRVPTCWAMRIIVQLRLGLPLAFPSTIDEALASGEPTCTARGGRVQGPIGDSASNIGREISMQYNYRPWTFHKVQPTLREGGGGPWTVNKDRIH